MSHASLRVRSETVGALRQITDDTGGRSKKDALHPRLTLSGEGKKAATEAGVYRLPAGAIIAVSRLPQ